MDDFPVNTLKVQDTVLFVRGGGTVPTRVYTFWLGDHGPFTEKMPIAGFDETEIGRRIDKLRDHLRQLPG
jgi:hypothetical protein